MRLPRMTTRRWMLAVLALSMPMCAARTWLNWKYRTERAEFHRQAITAGLGVDCKWCLCTMPNDPLFLAIFYGHSEPKRVWHARMAKKYELAASKPWLPVEPDTPSP
jgi:hypothetical protein